MAKALGKDLFPVRIGACSEHPLLRERQRVDIIEGGLDEYDRLITGLRKAGLDPSESFDWDPARPPYPGMVPFEEADAAVYFGRDPEIAQVRASLIGMARFPDPRMGVVVGASGAGKSSLLRSGVIPRLRKDEKKWLILPRVEPGRRPLNVLRSALIQARPTGQNAGDWEATVDKALEGHSADLNVLIQRLAPDREPEHILLFIDQMEQALLNLDQGETQPFFRFLSRVVSMPEARMLVISTLRSDMLDVLQRRRELEGVQFELLNLGPMAIERHAAIIEGPANRAGMAIEQGLLAQLSRDVSGDDAVPLLAFTLRRLYDVGREQRKLTIADYKAMGGVFGAVERVLQESFGGQPSGEIEVALKTMLLGLVDFGEKERPQPRWLARDEVPSGAKQIMDRLIDVRLLVSTREADGKDYVHAAHEALFRVSPTLENWLSDHRDLLAWRRRIARDVQRWLEQGKKDEDLLSGSRLREALRWFKLPGSFLKPEELDLIETSDRRERRRRIQRRSIWIGSSIAVLLLLSTSARLFDAVHQWSISNAMAEVYEPRLGKLMSTRLYCAWFQNLEMGKILNLEHTRFGGPALEHNILISNRRDKRDELRWYDTEANAPALRVKPKEVELLLRESDRKMDEIARITGLPAERAPLPDPQTLVAGTLWSKPGAYLDGSMAYLYVTFGLHNFLGVPPSGITCQTEVVVKTYEHGLVIGGAPAENCNDVQHIYVLIADGTSDVDRHRGSWMPQSSLPIFRNTFKTCTCWKNSPGSGCD